MCAVSKPQGKAMYVASAPDQAWLLTEQRELHERSSSWGGSSPPAFAITDGEPDA